MKKVTLQVLQRRSGKKNTTTRGAILEVASLLFKNKGFSRTSLDEVAVGAGITKATIFYYFLSKERLLYEVLCEATRRGIKMIQLIMSSSAPEEKLENVIKGHLKFNLYENSFGGISTLELKNLSPKLRESYALLRDEFEQLYREMVQEAMSAGQIRQGDVKVQTCFILGAVNSVNRWFKRSGSLSLEEVGDELCKLIFC